MDSRLILSQSAAKDRLLAYRRKVQRYAAEKRRIWEEVAHGFVYGSREFVDWLKSGLLPAEPDIEIPRQRKYIKASTCLYRFSNIRFVFNYCVERGVYGIM